MKKLLTAFGLMLALAAGTSSSAMAKDYENASTKLQVTAPDDWKAEEGDPLTLTAPDDLATVVMTHVEPDNVDAALEAIGAELAKVLTDVKVGDEVKKHDLHGMAAVSAEGTAKHEGAEVRFAVAVVDAGDDCLVVVAFGGAEALKTHADAVNKLFESIKKDE